MTESIAGKIKRLLLNKNVNSCSILIDGKYFTEKGKMVYVHVVNNEQDPSIQHLEFYIKVKRDNNDVVEEVPNAVDKLRTKLYCTNYAGIELGGVLDDDSISASVCDNMKFVILKSALYKSVEAIVASGNTRGKTFIFCGKQVPLDVATELYKEFEYESIKQYADLVYSQKFLNRLWRPNRFYGIQKSFIPVFIDYTAVYNPLNGENQNVKRSKLFREAVSKNRFVQSENLSCYFLTHAEICRALGMHNFMRFTPSALYRIYVGLMYPSYAEFPNKSNKMMIQLNPQSLTQTGLKRKYTIPEFNSIVEKFREKYESASSTEEKHEVEEAINELRTYTEADSLLALCITEYSRLTNIGASILDNRSELSPRKLRDYLDSARMIYEEVKTND